MTKKLKNNRLSLFIYNGILMLEVVIARCKHEDIVHCCK